MLLKQLDKQEVITPFYQSGNSQELYDKMKEALDAGMEVGNDVNHLWMRDLVKVQTLMRQWEETGEFPDELSDYVLEPFPQE